MGIERVEQELKDAKKIYTTIILSLDEVEPYVSPQTLNRRKYMQMFRQLEKYIEKLEEVVEEGKEKGILKRIFSSKQPEEIMEQYKRTNGLDMSQLAQCGSCQCFTCSRECEMVGCKLCSKGGKIKGCDNKTKSVYLFQNKWLELEKEETGVVEVYDVLAIIEDKEFNQFYIILSLRGERFVLYYYPDLHEDTYGEISDTDDFNFAIQTFEEALYA